jgi:hypothetical protein
MIREFDLTNAREMGRWDRVFPSSEAISAARDPKHRAYTRDV